MSVSIDKLPRIQDDPRVQKLQGSLKELAADLEEAMTRLDAARQEATAAHHEADELEIEQYATDDVTEKDVKKAKAKAEKLTDEVASVERKIDTIETAIDRVKERLKTEREEAGPRVYDAYAEASLQTSKDVMRVLPAAIEALENMNAVRRLASGQKVYQPGDERPRLGTPIRAEKIAPQLDEALKLAEKTAAELAEYVEG